MAAFVERWVFQTSVLVRTTLKGFESCPKYPDRFLFQRTEQGRKLTYQGREHLLKKKKSQHSSVSVGCADWLLLFIRSDATTAVWIDGKAVIPNSSCLSHGISKIPSSPWKSRCRAKSSCLKCLEQITKLRWLSLCMFCFHEIDSLLCTFLLFRTIISP